MGQYSWTKIQIPGVDNYSRTHSCEVAGSQLVVLGGYPPSVVVEESVPCVKELIRVFDMNDISVSFSNIRGFHAWPFLRFLVSVR
jgi:DNA primase catalytic subunit